MRGRRVAIGAALGAVAAATAYLTAWPIAIQPVAWTAPRAPMLEGPYAPNTALAAAEWLAGDLLHAPEATAIGADGTVYTGTADGRIWRWPQGAPAFEPWADTGGRPLGMALDPSSGALIVSDATKGLLRVRADDAAKSPTGDRTVETLASGHAGVPFALCDDVDVAADGTVYFSDASARFGLAEAEDDVVEHSCTGRLLSWAPATRATRVLLDRLCFANGVALGPDDAFVLVSQTASYHLTRYWLRGPKAGNAEPFFDNLPGFPDNVTYAHDRGVFWVALYAPRNWIVDGLAAHPFWRKVMWRLPAAVRPAPKRHAFVLGIELSGRVGYALQNDAPDSYAPITSAREHGGWLWLGSVKRDGIARIKAP